jgi:hypothetical protein
MLTNRIGIAFGLRTIPAFKLHLLAKSLDLNSSAPVLLHLKNSTFTRIAY